MKLPASTFAIGEQAFASGFTFFLFLAAARLLDKPELELYSALFSLNQSFSFFLFGLVLLPMASSAGQDVEKQLGISIVLMGALLVGFALLSPFAMHLFASFDGRISPALWMLSLSFFASQCIYETARWLTIRLRGARAAIAITMARFILFFGTIILLGTKHLNGTNFVLIQITANILALGGFTFILRDMLHEVRLSMPDRTAIRHFANFGTSVASFFTNLATVAIVDWGLGGAGLAAFQAVRSATNPIGLLSQIIDNHISSDLARSGRRFSSSKGTILLLLAGSAALLLAATLLGPMILHLLFGADFAGNWVLVPLLLMASLAHALTRPIFVNWRLTGATRMLNMYTAILVFVVLPALVALGWSGYIYHVVALFALQPVAAVLLSLLKSKSNRKELGQ